MLCYSIYLTTKKWLLSFCEKYKLTSEGKLFHVCMYIYIYIEMDSSTSVMGLMESVEIKANFHLLV